MSRDVLLLVRFKSDDSVTNLKMYSMRYLVFCLLTMGASVIDAVTVQIFSKLFSF